MVRAGRLLLAIVTGITGLLGCQDTSVAPAPPITAATMAQYVSGPAAANLDASGHFQLAGPPAGGKPQLTREQAEAIANAWPRQFGEWVRQSLENVHGGPIDVKALKPCGQSLYAGSSFEPFDDALIAKPTVPPFQRIYGPWWLVTLCGANGTPQVGLAVSAYGTDLTIQNGEIRFPDAMRGEWFAWEGIPRRLGHQFIESPERVAQRIALFTGRRVNQVPELFVPDRTNGFPTHARWGVTLDGAVNVRHARGTAISARLYSWRRPDQQDASLQVPSASQPDSVPFMYPEEVYPSEGRTGRWVQGFARRRPDVPTQFETVIAAEGN
jgi:hypothetical protein